MIKPNLVILSHKIVNLFPLKLKRGDQVRILPSPTDRPRIFTLINDNEKLGPFEKPVIKKEDLKINLLLEKNCECLIYP